jgi:phosphoribosylglycinamide formyltransferase 1
MIFAPRSHNAKMKSIVILISGRGSNMEAIINAVRAGTLPIEIRAVIANRPNAAGINTAAAQSIATRVIDHKTFADRNQFDLALANTINEYAPDYVVLAGFMRVLGAAFIAKYPNRILNIHPSLLPSFPGLHTHQAALDAGVKLHGATVHVVTPALDHGPILAQAAVPVLPNDSESTLAARVLAQEHVIYPEVLRRLARGEIEIVQNGAGGVVQIVHKTVLSGDAEMFLRAPSMTKP